MPKRRGRPFQAGAPSPNPSGRPLGSKNRTTLAAELMLDGEAKAITRKAVELAKAGDLTAIRLCFEHIFPLRRGRRISIDLASVNLVEDGPRVLAAIVAAVAAGELTLEDAADLSKLVESVIKCKEMTRRLNPLKIDKMTEEQLENFLLSNDIPVTIKADPETETEYRPEQDHFTVPADQKATSPRSAPSATYSAPCDSN
jgi:hypothetical protein